MSMLSKANKKSKKKYSKSKKDINIIHDELSRFLNSISKETRLADNTAIRDTRGANIALQEQLGAITDTNRAEATDEQSRLGIEGAGMGSYDEDADFQQGLAAQAGNDSISNLRQMKSNTGALGKLMNTMNRGVERSSLHDRKNLLKDEMDANKEAYKQMLASRRSYGGGYGGGGFTPYGGAMGGGGGGNDFANQAAERARLERERQKRLNIALTNLKRKELGVKGGVWAGTRTPWNSTIN